LARRCSGHIAGIDIKEQLKKRSQFYQQLLQERQTDTEKARSAYVLYWRCRLLRCALLTQSHARVLCVVLRGLAGSWSSWR